MFVLLFFFYSSSIFYFFYLIFSFFFLLFFFFNQKTAYELLFSDWSSDVCSSDLRTGAGRPDRPARAGGSFRACTQSGVDRDAVQPAAARHRPALRHRRRAPRRRAGGGRQHLPVAGAADADHRLRRRRGGAFDHQVRSEEHTSELQSLMRISYAVFCLKKKTTTSTQTRTQ